MGQGARAWRTALRTPPAFTTRTEQRLYSASRNSVAVTRGKELPSYLKELNTTACLLGRCPVQSSLSDGKTMLWRQAAASELLTRTGLNGCLALAAPLTALPDISVCWARFFGQKTRGRLVAMMIRPTPIISGRVGSFFTRKPPMGAARTPPMIKPIAGLRSA